MELQEIIKKLKFICNEELNDRMPVSNDMVLDCAVRIFNTGRINEEPIQNHVKPKIVSQKPQEPQKQPVKTILSSEKQKSLITKLKIPFTDKTTIKEAKELIELKLGKKEYKEY